MEGLTPDYFTGRMFRRQFGPALASALGLAVSDMADALVVGRRMGAVGLAAISLALPVLMVMNVLMHGFGLGGSICYSIQQAKGERDQALAGFQGVLTSAVLTGAVLAVLGSLFLTPLLDLLGTTAEDGLLFETSRTYLQIILWGTPLLFASYGLDYFLRNDGQEKLASAAFITGNLTDFVLNFVFVLFLDLGAAGAAWATLIGQVLSFSIGSVGVLRKSGSLSYFPFRPDFKGVFECFRVGFSSSSQYLFSMLFILIANNVLLEWSGSGGVAVFDLIQNTSFLILYLYMGAGKAAQPILSTFQGEYNQDGQHRALALALIWGTAVGGAAICAVALFPGTVCSLFGLTGEAAALGCYALRVYCLSAGLAGINVVLEAYCQSCGRKTGAFLLAVLRGAALLLPFTLLFAALGENAFWWLFPVTEAGTLLIFLLVRGRLKGGEEIDPARIFRRTIQSRNEEISSLTLKIEEFCEKWDANVKQTYFVTMSVEELCAVILQKGFQGAGGWIQVTLVAQEDGDFTLHIRDSAVYFDPFSMKARRMDEGGDMDALGVLVIRKKAKEFFYRRYQGFNSLIVRI